MARPALGGGDPAAGQRSRRYGRDNERTVPWGEGQNLGSDVRRDAEASEQLQLFASGIGVTPSAEGRADEGDELLEGRRWRVEVPANVSWGPLSRARLLRGAGDAEHSCGEHRERRADFGRGAEPHRPLRGRGGQEQARRSDQHRDGEEGADRSDVPTAQREEHDRRGHDDDPDERGGDRRCDPGAIVERGIRTP